MQKKAYKGIWYNLALGILGIAFMLVFETSLFDTTILKLNDAYQAQQIQKQLDSLADGTLLDKSIFAYQRLILSQVKSKFQLYSYLIAMIPLIVGNAIYAYNSKKKSVQLCQMGYLFRDMFVSVLPDYTVGNISIDRNRINIRFYMISRKNKLVMVDYEGFYTDIINGPLEFSILNNQGLVSKSINTGSIGYECTNCLSPVHNLTQYQETLLQNTKFAIAIPILGPNDQVISVLSLDSCDIINIRDDKADEFADYCALFGYRLYNELPRLFGRI